MAYQTLASSVPICTSAQATADTAPIVSGTPKAKIARTASWASTDASTTTSATTACATGKAPRVYSATRQAAASVSRASRAPSVTAACPIITTSPVRAANSATAVPLVATIRRLFVIRSMANAAARATWKASTVTGLLFFAVNLDLRESRL